MANIIDGVKYTKEHEWIKVDGDIVVTGITDYAQSELSDIVMVEPPGAGQKIKAGDAIGTIEAVKAVTDLYACLNGEVTEVNDAVVADPSIINKDAYGKGWIYKMKIDDPKEIDNLLSPEQYKELIAKS